MKTIKRKNIYLVSEKLRLKGICDDVNREDGIQTPVDGKKGKCNAEKPYKNDVIQLLCYILLLEDYFKSRYTHSYIIYVSIKLKFKVIVSQILRKRLQKYFKEIKAYYSNGKIPNRQKSKSWCTDCSYEEYCWSV
ncbi:hypothetical protein LCGC14_0654130 [marine sediment metagenome]|uniref:CRISPR-associated exonuclease Cas4 n=1 Tax=marine sediment metagenome TaxID=412755 RepID=A0A0F9TH85_9ZZZZ